MKLLISTAIAIEMFGCKLNFTGASHRVHGIAHCEKKLTERACKGHFWPRNKLRIIFCLCTFSGLSPGPPRSSLLFSPSLRCTLLFIILYTFENSGATGFPVCFEFTRTFAVHIELKLKSLLLITKPCVD